MEEGANVFETTDLFIGLSFTAFAVRLRRASKSGLKGAHGFLSGPENIDNAIQADDFKNDLDRLLEAAQFQIAPSFLETLQVGEDGVKT